MALTVTYTPDKNVYDDTQTLIFNSKWLSAWNAIVFKIENDKFPTNTADPQTVYSSVEDNGGRARFVIYSGVYPEYYRRGYYVTISGTVYDGTYRVLDYDPYNGTFTLDLTYSGDDSGTASKFYANYIISLENYVGLPTAHIWQALKPLRLAETLQQRPDDDNVVVFDISTGVQSDINTINDLELVSLPNDVNLWTSFNVKYGEQYDEHVGVGTTPSYAVAGLADDDGSLQLQIPTSNIINVGDYVVLTSSTDNYEGAVVRVIRKNTSNGDITINSTYDASPTITFVQAYDLTIERSTISYTSEGNTYYATNSKQSANEYGSNLAPYVNVKVTDYEADNLTEFERMQLTVDKFFDYTAIISELFIATLTGEQLPALRIIQYDQNNNVIGTDYFAQGNQEEGVYRFSFLEDVPFTVGVLTFLVGANGVISPTVTSSSGTTSWTKNGIDWTSGTSASAGDVIRLFHTVPSAITQINLASCNISYIATIANSIINQACTFKLAGNTLLNKYGLINIVDAKVTTGGSTFEWLSFADGYDDTSLARLLTASPLVTWMANNIYLTTTKTGTFNPTITSVGDTTVYHFSDGTTTSNGAISKAVTGTTRQVYVYCKAPSLIRLNSNNITLFKYQYVANVSGQIEFHTNAGLTSVINPSSSQAITRYWGYSCGLAGILNLATFTNLSGSIDVNSNSGLTSITNPTTMGTVTLYSAYSCNLTGNFNISGIANFTGDFLIYSNPLLTSITNPTSTSGTGFTQYQANNCNLTGNISFAGCKFSAGYLRLYSNPLLTSITQPTATGNALASGFEAYSCGLTGTLTLTNFTGGMGRFQVNGNSGLTGVALPTTSTSCILFRVDSCNITGSLDVSMFTGLSTDFRCSTNPLLTDIKLPTLFGNSTKFTTFAFSSCAVDTVTNLGSDTTNKKFDVTGCAVTFSNNAMTTAQVNQILVDFNTVTTNVGTSKTMVGTGNAALSGAGSTARTSMLAKGWSTITIS